MDKSTMSWLYQTAMNSLPNEIIFSVMSFLSPEDLLSLAIVGDKRLKNCSYKSLRKCPLELPKMLCKLSAAGDLEKVKNIFMCVNIENISVIEMGVKNNELSEGEISKLVDSNSSHHGYHVIGSYGMTPLMLAASNGHIHVCEYLIVKQNAKLCARDDDQNTALIHATRSNRSNVVQLLLYHNANTMAQDRYGLTSAYFAAMHGYLDILKKLIEKNVSVLNFQGKNGMTLLIVASLKGRVNVIRLLLDNNANIMAKDESGMHATYLAARKGNLDCLKLLVKKNEYVVNLKGWQGQTPLIAASFHGKIDVVKFLLDKNVNIMAKDQSGMHAAYLAAKSGNLSLLKLLVEKNEDVANLKGFQGQTPLMAASFHGKIDVCKYLLTHTKAEVNQQDDSGRTALFWAVDNYRKEKNKIEIVDLLIKNGAMNLKNEFDETALDIARNRKHELIVKKLEDKFHMWFTSKKAKEDFL